MVNSRTSSFAKVFCKFSHARLGPPQAQTAKASHRIKHQIDVSGKLSARAAARSECERTMGDEDARVMVMRDSCGSQLVAVAL